VGCNTQVHGTMVGISLYSSLYLYLKLVKVLCLSYYHLCFLFNKIRKQEGETCSAKKLEGASGKVAQTTYIHVSKCKKKEKVRENMRTFSEFE
jgi:hypothetical protein